MSMNLISAHLSNQQSLSKQCNMTLPTCDKLNFEHKRQFHQPQPLSSEPQKPRLSMLLKHSQHKLRDKGQAWRIASHRLPLENEPCLLTLGPEPLGLA